VNNKLHAAIGMSFPPSLTKERAVALGVSLLLLTTQAASLAQTPVQPPPIIQSNMPAPNPKINLNPPVPSPLSSTAPITLPAYNEATGPTLSIEQAVAISLKSNTQVTASALTLQRVRYEMREITGQAYPQISISASDTYSNRDQSPGGVTSASTNLDTNGLQIPTITDAQSSALLSSTSVSSAQTASTSTSSTTGGGSSTTGTTVYLNPVTGPIGGGASASSSGTSASQAIRAPAAGSGTGTTGTTTTSTSPILQQFSSTPFRINNYGGKLSLSQVIDVNGLGSTSEKLLKNEVTFYTLDLERVENEVAYNVKNQYYSVLRAEEQLTTDREQVTNTQAELTDAQNRYDAGTSPAFDVLSAQTQLSSAQQALINAEITLDVQRATLNNLLNRPIDTPFSAVKPAGPTLPTTDTDSTEVAVAYAKRPELLESLIALDIANKLVKLDHAGLLPQVALTAAMTYNGYASFPNGLGTSSSITAAVTLPLFDGGQTAARINEAKTDVETQKTNRQGLLNDIALEVRSSFVNVKNGSALVAANVQGVAEARESLRLANIRYKAGTGTLLEVTNAEANLAVAETNLSSAQFQLSTAYASLLRSEGLR
jgi:outer membrane protein TolC